MEATSTASPQAASLPANLPGGVNPLDFLYKLAIQRGMKAPEFKQVTEQGPAHMKTFVWHCSFNGVVAQGTGRSKKEAKIAAAKGIRDSLDYGKLLAAAPFQSALERKRKNREAKEAHGGFGGAALNKRKRLGGGYGPVFAHGPNNVGPPYGYSNPFFGGGFYGGPPAQPVGFTGGPPMGQSPAGCFDLEAGDHPSGSEENKAEGLEDQVAGGGQANEGSSWDPSCGPTREDFMHPSFGGFFSDKAATAFDRASVEDQKSFDRQRCLMVAEYQSRMAMGYRSRLSKLDRHAIRKHKDIFPKENELSAILKLVTQTENALKSVAELLNGRQEEEEGEAVKICGMVRVGDLSKGLLLASDREVNLVLLCKACPTRRLLSDAEALLKEKMSEVASIEQESKLVVSADRVKLEGNLNGDEAVDASVPGGTCFEYKVHVTLTSISLTDECAIESLPRDKCLNALSELRHSKWFSVTAANLPSCVECIRIVKDLALRDVAWKALSSWAIEVLVERSLFSAWMPLNPAASLMRVMEIVSSGIFLKDGKGLADPCEKDHADVAAGLSDQQKEDLTHSAQKYLRFMHFRQIHKVLGISEDDFLDVERPGFRGPFQDEIKKEEYSLSGEAQSAL